MTHLFLAVVSSLYDPLAMKSTVKNTRTTCAPHGMPDLASSSPVSRAFAGIQTLCGHCSVAWAGWRRTCVAGQGVNDAHTRGPVVTEEPWLNMDRHTLAVSQSQGNATADYPPSPCLQTPSFLSSHTHAHTVILSWIAVALYFCLHTYIRPLLCSLLCCFSRSNTWYTPLLETSRPLADLDCFCHPLYALAPQIGVHLASAVVSNGSTDINMTQLISECLGIKG